VLNAFNLERLIILIDSAQWSARLTLYSIDRSCVRVREKENE